jgi:hypothetical protein
MNGLAVALRIVRVKSDARRHLAWKSSRQIDRKADGIERIGAGGAVRAREPDDDEPNDSGRCGARHDGVGPLGEMVPIEVAVGVDESEHFRGRPRVARQVGGC